MLAVLRSNNYSHLRNLISPIKNIHPLAAAIVVNLVTSGVSYGQEVNSNSESNLCRRAVCLLLEVNVDEINLAKELVFNRGKHINEHIFSGGNLKFKCTFNPTSESENSFGKLDLIQYPGDHHPLANAGKYEFIYTEEVDLISIDAVQLEGI